MSDKPIQFKSSENWPILTIRQPWAWAIIHAGKDIENRPRRTNYRGRFWVQASASMQTSDIISCSAICENLKIDTKQIDLPCGGIIGSVELVDCVNESDSPWFFGKYGYVLKDPRPCEFVPMKGQLGFFKRPDEMEGVKP